MLKRSFEERCKQLKSAGPLEHPLAAAANPRASGRSPVPGPVAAEFDPPGVSAAAAGTEKRRRLDSKAGMLL